MEKVMVKISNKILVKTASASALGAVKSLEHFLYQN